jgi:phosphate:Na+ symporter
MLGIVITLAAQALITLPAGLAVMLGAEIGTCADTLVASLGRSRAALRAGIFHLSFNIVTATLGVLFIEQLAWLARAFAAEQDVARQIANAHVAFNVIGVALFLGFTTHIARVLQRLVPGEDGQPPSQPRVFERTDRHVASSR